MRVIDTETTDNVEVVKWLVRARAVVKAVLKDEDSEEEEDEVEWTLLARASYRGKKGTVLQLIRSGAHVDVEIKYCSGHDDISPQSPLYIAAHMGHMDVVDALLFAGAEIDKRDRDGYTPLHIASFMGNVNIVNALIDAGAALETMNDDWSPLHTASNEGHNSVVDVLISRGADVNRKARGGSTPLHQACTHGHADVVAGLIAAKANVNVQRSNGWSGLHLASAYGHQEVVELLVSSGADVNQVTNEGWTPLDLVAFKFMGESETAKSMVNVISHARRNAQRRTHHDDRHYCNNI